MNQLKTAIVVGATGATGSNLVTQLLDHPAYQKVVVLARRPLSFEHKNLIAHTIDFDQPEQWRSFVQGDELFSALGSTLKLAGGKTQQHKIDYGYQLSMAQAAKQNGVDKLILVSSPNANSASASFYLGMKGELDDAVTALHFAQCILIKPSIIDAERPEGRLGEKMGSIFLHKATDWLRPLRKYRPISAAQLATACINSAQQSFSENPVNIELDALFEYLKL